jgi:glycosyltransferase involved in cell wall biosynthesis
MKLVVLTNILAPYRISLFEEMRRCVDDFTVLLMAPHEENRLWRLSEPPFKTILLRGVHLKKRGETVSRHLNYGVVRTLYWLNPDVVLSGGFGPANLSAWVYCKLFRKKYIGWGELSSQDAANDSSVRRTLRKIMTRHSDGAIASSKEAREVFIRYGAKEDRILNAPMPIDVAYFNKRTKVFRESESGLIRRASYPGPVLLSIGQLIRRKGYIEMFQIYEQVRARRPDVFLFIAGEGPERSLYERFVKEKGFDRVRFLGYQQMEALPELFAVADLFVFHTLFDPFGAVLSEAMAAEVPVVSSIHAAATWEWVEEGVTGFRIDPKEAAASADTLLRVLERSPEERRAIGRRGYERVKECNPKNAAVEMVRFMKSLNAPEDRPARSSAQVISSTEEKHG